MKLSGIVKDKNGKALCNVLVEVKNSEFETLYSVKSDSNGYYAIDLPFGNYPFVTAVKEYGEKYLEFWCQNLDMSLDRELEIVVDKLEIYGLHVFEIKSAYNALMVYFRPMSLTKFLNGSKDLCPDIESIEVAVDKQKANVLIQNKVLEYGGDNNMTAYLLQIENPNADRDWLKLDISVYDKSGDCGAASIYKK